MAANPTTLTEVVAPVVPLTHTIPEATQYLRGVGRTKLYELIEAGEIETITVGRRRLVPHQALVDFVERTREAQHNDAA